MFTGIIEEIGEVKTISKFNNALKIKISAKKVLEDIKTGDSISTNGVCLTVTDFTKSDFVVDAVEETVKSTNLSNLKIKDKLNLERALTLSSRLGGHIVQGHIDSIGEIINIRKKDLSTIYEIKVSNSILDLIVTKGSITLNGVSLTVSKVNKNSFEISVIPETIKKTNIENLNIKDKVNLETDIIGRYIQKLIYKENENNISLKFLVENGF